MPGPFACPTIARGMDAKRRSACGGPAGPDAHQLTRVAAGSVLHFVLCQPCDDEILCRVHGTDDIEAARQREAAERRAMQEAGA